MSTTDLRYDAYRIDVLWLARQAIRFVLDRPGRVLALGWVPLLLVLAVDLVAAALAAFGPAGMALASLVRGLGTFAFGAIFIVRWHRLVLLDETAPRELFSPDWRFFLIVALKLAVPMVAGGLIVVLIAALPPHIVTAPLAFVGLLALLAGGVRVGLAFPAAALGRQISFRASWGRLSGNGIRLLACALLCYAPFLILRYLVDQIGLVSPGLVLVVLDALGVVLTLAGAAVVATALSDVFRNISNSAIA